MFSIFVKSSVFIIDLKFDEVKKGQAIGFIEQLGTFHPIEVCTYIPE